MCGVIAVMNLWREKAGDVRIPIRHASSGKVQAGWNGALEHVPGGRNVTRPKHRSITLRAQISGAGEDHHAAAVAEVAAKALVHRCGMEQWIDVVIARTRSDGEGVLV